MSAESDCRCRGAPLAPSLRFLIQLGSRLGSLGAIRELARGLAQTPRIAGPHSPALTKPDPQKAPKTPLGGVPRRHRQSYFLRMTNLRALIFLFAIVGLFGPVGLVSAAQQSEGTQEPPVVVTARTDPERVSIGTPFRYTVEVRAEKDVELIVPVLGGQIGEFTVTDFGEEPLEEIEDHVVVTRWYTLVTYSTGYLFIPGLTVQYRIAGDELARVDGDDIAIKVVSLVDQDPGATDIRDIKGPVAVPFDWTPVLVGGAMLAGLIVLGLVAAHLLRRIGKQSVPAPPPPPDVVALEALARLRHRRLTEPEERAEWYVALSAIVRTYIEGRFRLRAPEMTTEEFILAVQRDSPLIPEHRQLLGEFLAECDLVKFARYLPALEEAERVYAAARRFIEESRPVPAVEESRRAA